MQSSGADVLRAERQRLALRAVAGRLAEMQRLHAEHEHAAREAEEAGALCARLETELSERRLAREWMLAEREKASQAWAARRAALLADAAAREEELARLDKALQQSEDKARDATSEARHDLFLEREREREGWALLRRDWESARADSQRREDALARELLLLRQQVARAEASWGELQQEVLALTQDCARLEGQLKEALLLARQSDSSEERVRELQRQMQREEAMWASAREDFELAVDRLERQQRQDRLAYDRSLAEFKRREDELVCPVLFSMNTFGHSLASPSRVAF
jgi:hypothetical protein